MAKKDQTLKGLLGEKKFHQAALTDSIRSVAIEMPKTHSSAAVVMDSEGKLVGIITEQDIVERTVGVSRNVDETTVEQIMTPNPITVSVDQSIGDALFVMMENTIRTLPVMDGDDFIGIIDIRDLYQGMQRLLEEQIRANKVLIDFAFGNSYAS